MSSREGRSLWGVDKLYYAALFELGNELFREPQTDCSMVVTCSVQKGCHCHLAWEGARETWLCLVQVITGCFGGRRGGVWRWWWVSRPPGGDLASHGRHLCCGVSGNWGRPALASSGGGGEDGLVEMQSWAGLLVLGGFAVVGMVESPRLGKAAEITKANRHPNTPLPAKPRLEVPHPHGFWTPPGMRTPPPPWAACSSVWPIFQWRNFSQ